jgi:uncharacterized membrane protein
VKLFRGDPNARYERPVGQMVIATLVSLLMGSGFALGALILGTWLAANEMSAGYVPTLVASIGLGAVLGVVLPLYAWWRWFEERDTKAIVAGRVKEVRDAEASRAQND